MYIYVVVFSSSSVLILYDIKLCISAHFLFYIVYVHLAHI